MVRDFNRTGLKMMTRSLRKSCIDGSLGVNSECEDICVVCVCSPRTYIFREALNDRVDKMTYSVDIRQSSQSA